MFLRIEVLLSAVRQENKNQVESLGNNLVMIIIEINDQSIRTVLAFFLS